MNRRSFLGGVLAVLAAPLVKMLPKRKPYIFRGHVPDYENSTLASTRSQDKLLDENTYRAMEVNFMHYCTSRRQHFHLKPDA